MTRQIGFHANHIPFTPTERLERVRALREEGIIAISNSIDAVTELDVIMSKKRLVKVSKPLKPKDDKPAPIEPIDAKK